MYILVLDKTPAPFKLRCKQNLEGIGSKATSAWGFQLCLSGFVHLFLSLYSQFGLSWDIDISLARTAA